MKFLFSALLMVGSNSQAAQLLVDYSAHFQAGASKVQIFDDGKVTRSEMVCCPPHDEVQPDKKLTAAQISDLKNLIADAAQGKISVKNKVGIPLGERSGALIAYIGSKKVLIRSIDRKTSDNGNRSFNVAESARKIEKIVYQFAKQKLGN